MMQIGTHKLSSKVILAPMAGVTDLPFRQLCSNLGAGLVVSEMVGANSLLHGSDKSKRRGLVDSLAGPKSVQIVGFDPQMMANAAKEMAANGADIIDINMGCPAKKICKTLSGSALLRDEALVKEILTAMVNAVSIPVTLKIRTGWCTLTKNGVTVAKIAEDCGIQALTVHGRTRNCFFKGEAEYDTIAAIKAAIKIPVIANGDINDPIKAKYVLDYTNADAVMIGRGAQGRPWIFREINHYLSTGQLLPEPTIDEIQNLLTNHVLNLYEFYGEHRGAMIAKKHVSWYTKGQHGGASFRDSFNRLDSAQDQLHCMHEFFTNILPSQTQTQIETQTTLGA